MTAYYNEIDPFAAQWLRNLIAAEVLKAYMATRYTSGLDKSAP